MKKNMIVQKWLGLAVVLVSSSSVWAGFTDGFESGLGAWFTVEQVQAVTFEAPRDPGLSGNWLPTEGAQFASLRPNSSPPSPSTMYRRFDGLAGETLQFDYYFDLGSGYESATVTLILPDSTSQYPLSLVATTPIWQTFSYTLSQTGTYSVGFEIASWAEDSVLGIDNVRVGPDTVVPAPGALLLAGMGTGLVGWLRWRRAL